MTSIRVYEYGLTPPHTNAERVDEQMVKAHRYRNMLVEIERERRAKVRAAMGAHPDLAPLEEELRSLVAERDVVRGNIQQQRRRTRSRSEPQEWRQAAKDLAAKIKPLRERVKAVRKAVAEDSTVKIRMDEAESDAKNRLKKARAECGVYWGTYLLQEAAADQARKERTPPKFVRWRGEGRVSVQIQGGIGLEGVGGLFGADTQVHVVRPDPRAWDPGSRRGVRRRMSRTILRLRVGSEGAGNRRPIWAEWRMVMHRPIPAGAIIKVVTVSRRRRDCVSDEWRVQFTVDVSACQPVRVAPATGVVALNLGFCQRGNGIRSGFLVGDDGMEREILVEKSDNIREMSRATSSSDVALLYNQTSPEVHTGQPVDTAVPGHGRHDARTGHAARGQCQTSPEDPGPVRLGYQENSTSTSIVEACVEACPADRETRPAAPGPARPGYQENSTSTPVETTSKLVETSPEDPGPPHLTRQPPNWIINGLSKADSIRSFRDRAMDKMKALMVTWGRGEQIDAAAVVDTIREFTKDEPARKPELPDAFKDEPTLSSDRGVSLDQPGGANAGTVAKAEPTRSDVGRWQVMDQPGDIGTTKDELARQPDEVSRLDRPGGPISTRDEPTRRPDQMPEWFTKATDTMHAWRSAERFRRLAYEWREQRFPGDEIAFALLWAWRSRDEHLERYESGLRRSALRDRREGYRILAAQMARRYRFLVIDDTDLADFQRNPAVESKEVAIPTVKRNQRVAAGSELRTCMINAFGEERVIRLDHKDMTRRCHLCGHINEWDRLAADRCHTCDGCGARWDQDFNNGKNLLAEHRRSIERGDTPTKHARKPSRSDRFREARAASANSAA